MINVATETKKLFEQLKPLLDDGYTYVRAYQKYANINHRRFTSRYWFRELLRYGESQGYPRDTNYGIKNKYGLFNIHLHKTKNTRTGYLWTYEYINEKTKKRVTLSSFDLRTLRKQIEKKKLPYMVTDINKARKSYEFNDELIKKHPKKTRTTSGVKYVSKTKKRNNHYWRYLYDGICLYDKSLEKLKGKVLEKQGLWNIVDKNKYDYWIKKELEYERK